MKFLEEKSMKKNILASILITFLMAMMSLTVVSAEVEDPLNLASDSTSAILIEQNTGQVLFNKNEHEKLPPASMTKIMTLLLIMESLDEGTLTLEEKIRVSERASSMGGSLVFLETNEEMSVED